MFVCFFILYYISEYGNGSWSVRYSRYYLLLQRVLNTAYFIKSFLNTSSYIILKCYPKKKRTYSLSFCLQDNGLSKSSTISSSTAEAMRQYVIISDMKTILHQLRDVLIYSIKFQITLHCTIRNWTIRNSLKTNKRRRLRN